MLEPMLAVFNCLLDRVSKRFLAVDIIDISEIGVAESGFTRALMVVFGGVVVMWLWKIGYWFEDGESILGHFAFQSVANEFIGFFLSPSKIIWFWTTERPYFRACTIATWLALTIFWLLHFSNSA